MNERLVKKFTNKHRTFKKEAYDRMISVYNDGNLKGFIWNVDRTIWIDGEPVNSADFFKK